MYPKRDPDLEALQCIISPCQWSFPRPRAEKETELFRYSRRDQSLSCNLAHAHNRERVPLNACLLCYPLLDPPLSSCNVHVLSRRIHADPSQSRNIVAGSHFRFRLPNLFRYNN